MRVEIKKVNGRKVVRRTDIKETIRKIKIGVTAFIAGVTLTLMFYPILRP